MEQYRCKKFPKNQSFIVEVPGSKSMTNRGLLLGALTKEDVILKGVLFSDDALVFMEALKDMGVDLIIDRSHHQVTVGGFVSEAFVENQKPKDIYVGSAGTAARFLTALLGLKGISCSVTASEQMSKRPMKPLLKALEDLGVVFHFPEQEYAFPFEIVRRDPVPVTRVDLNIDESSQFLSALMLAAPLCPDGLQIHLTGTRDARSYVTITSRMMEAFGVKVKKVDDNTYEIPPGACYHREQAYAIEPDVSAACYFYGLAALTGGTCVVSYVKEDSMQGDMKFLRVLEQMGCTRCNDPEGIGMKGPKNGVLQGVSVNMKDFSDQAITLACMAPFCQGETKISGVGHIRKQESDRIHGIATELSGLGVKVTEEDDGVTITPGPVKPGRVRTYEDHRMAMGFAMLGSVEGDVIIEDPMCCKKTFADYFTVLENLYDSLVDKS